MNKLQQTTNLKQIDGLIQELHTLRKNYAGVTDPTAKKGIEQNINTVEQELKDANAVSKNLIKTGFKNIDQNL